MNGLADLSVVEHIDYTGYKRKLLNKSSKSWRFWRYQVAEKVGII